MSEKKRSRKRKEYTGPGEEPQVEKPSKDEIKVAKWMKNNVKTKKTKFLSHSVEYFTASKAIDGLLKSQFAEGDSPLFTTREQAIEFLDIMLEHKFFHRAKKVPIVVEGSAGSKSSAKKEEKSDSAEKTSKKEAAETEAAEQSGNNGAASDENGGGATTSGEKKEKKKRKIRLDMHPEQVFADGSEAYVWIYDPIPIHYWIYGLVLLLGAIGICMFPLWPAMLRTGVYYLSMAAAGFLVFVLALVVIRLIVFTIVWTLTRSKLHFWIFPNLTEDVGFFASFWPLYESNYISDETADSKSNKSKKSSKSKSKKSKDKHSDNEDNDDVAADAEPLEPEKIEEIKEHDADMELRHRKGGGGKGDTEDESHSGSSSANEAAQDTESAKCSQNHSESESDGKDYEIISSSEVQNVK